MRARLAALWAGLLAWRRGNREAHRQAPAGACCAAPAAIYARRKAARRPH
ncbi:MAG: hypothetical protein PHY45_15100 [Rhodocyclaceae bacterium]|nr:hypothetical protein [Rhodocyclaceae bacterium]